MDGGRPAVPASRRPESVRVGEIDVEVVDGRGEGQASDDRTRPGTPRSVGVSSSTQVVIARCCCTTRRLERVERGRRRGGTVAPSACASSTRNDRCRPAAGSGGRQWPTQSAMPMDDASRQKSSPPGARTRHMPRSIASKCASSRAKWRTALAMTTSAEPSWKLVASIGSTRKLSGRQGRRQLRRRGRAPRRPPAIAVAARDVVPAAGGGRRDCGRRRSRHRGRACRVRMRPRSSWSNR